MSNMLNTKSRNGTERNEHGAVVPQNVLDIVRGALLPYQVPWDKVQDAIMQPEDDNKKSQAAEDRFLSTDEVAGILHVSRVTLHRYKKAGKIGAYKMGRRNLYSLREVQAALKGVNASNT